MMVLIVYSCVSVPFRLGLDHEATAQVPSRRHSRRIQRPGPGGAGDLLTVLIFLLVSTPPFKESWLQGQPLGLQW